MKTLIILGCLLLFSCEKDANSNPNPQFIDNMKQIGKSHVEDGFITTYEDRPNRVICYLYADEHGSTSSSPSFQCLSTYH